MKKDYRKDLEQAARQMILIHRADTLIKLILRTIVRTLKVKHAGMLVYDKGRDEYVVQVSRGRTGVKVPPGFAKVRCDNPLVVYFTEKRLHLSHERLLLDEVAKLAKESKRSRDKRQALFLEHLIFNLYLYQAKACIPGRFRDQLIGILFLGEKKNKKRLSEHELGFLSVLASDVVMAIKNAWLFEDLNQQLGKNKRLFIQTVAALSSSIEAKDKYTLGHTERVVKHSLAIAQHFKKSKQVEDADAFIENLKISALLHDIGKIGIPEKILNKKAPLNERERTIIQTHPLIGATILGHVEDFQEALLGVQHHHERYDGSGYPAGLKGRQIPLIASIIAVADAFDAMTIDRPYRKALSLKEAIREVKKNRAQQFVPAVVDAFLKVYKE